MTLPPHVAGLLAAAVAALAWSALTFSMRAALRGASVSGATAAVNLLNAVLVTLAALALLPLAALGLPPAGALGRIVLAGAMHMGVSRLLFYAALQRIGPGRCIPIVMSYPLVTALVAAAALDEALTWPIAAGLALLLGGIWLIVGARPPREAAPPPPGWRAWGYAFAGATSLLWGLAAVLFKSASLEVHPLAVSTLALWAGTGVAWAIAFSLGPASRPMRLPRRAWPWLLAAAACQAVAVPLYNTAFTLTLAVRVTAVVSTQPLIVLLISLAFLRESENITARLGAGAALAVAGTLLVIV